MMRQPDCRCGGCVRCREVIERLEPEPRPECACGEPLTRGTECDVCAEERAMAALDWREVDDAAE